jgi:hypothetical protein
MFSRGDSVDLFWILFAHKIPRMTLASFLLYALSVSDSELRARSQQNKEWVGIAVALYARMREVQTVFAVIRHIRHSSNLEGHKNEIITNYLFLLPSLTAMSGQLHAPAALLPVSIGGFQSRSGRPSQENRTPVPWLFSYSGFISCLNRSINAAHSGGL